MKHFAQVIWISFSVAIAFGQSANLEKDQNNDFGFESRLAEADDIDSLFDRGFMPNFDFSGFFTKLDASKEDTESVQSLTSAEVLNSRRRAHHAKSLAAPEQRYHLSSSFADDDYNRPERSSSVGFDHQAFKIPSHFQQLGAPLDEPHQLQSPEAFHVPAGLQGSFDESLHYEPQSFNLPNVDHYHPQQHQEPVYHEPHVDEFQIPGALRQGHKVSHDSYHQQPELSSQVPHNVEANLGSQEFSFSAPFGSENEFVSFLGGAGHDAFVGASDFGSRLEQQQHHQPLYRNERESPKPSSYQYHQSEPSVLGGFSDEESSFDFPQLTRKKKFTIDDEVAIIKNYQKKQQRQEEQKSNGPSLDSIESFGPLYSGRVARVDLQQETEGPSQQEVDFEEHFGVGFEFPKEEQKLFDEKFDLHDIASKLRDYEAPSEAPEIRPRPRRPLRYKRTNPNPVKPIPIRENTEYQTRSYPATTTPRSTTETTTRSTTVEVTTPGSLATPEIGSYTTQQGPDTSKFVEPTPERGFKPLFGGHTEVILVDPTTAPTTFKYEAPKFRAPINNVKLTGHQPTSSPYYFKSSTNVHQHVRPEELQAGDHLQAPEASQPTKVVLNPARLPRQSQFHHPVPLRSNLRHQQNPRRLRARSGIIGSGWMKTVTNLFSDDVRRPRPFY